MNNKGFTLVELIAVIGLLGIIMIIAIPAVTEVSSNIKESNLQNKIDVISSTVLKYANEYELDQIKKDGVDCSTSSDCCKDYTLDEILENGIYSAENSDGTITNPVTNEQLTGTIEICYKMDKLKLESSFIEG